MAATDSVATLEVGTGEERVLFRLTERTLTAEVSPEYWARIEAEAQRKIDDGTLVGAMLGAGAARALRHLKRWYLGPHDIATVEVSFDGQLLRVMRHGLGDAFGRDLALIPNRWHASLDAVGGSWSEGFTPEEAQAFVDLFRARRTARLGTLAYGVGVGARVLAGAAAAAALTAAVAWTLRGPRRPPGS